MHSHFIPENILPPDGNLSQLKLNYDNAYIKHGVTINWQIIYPEIQMTISIKTKHPSQEEICLIYDTRFTTLNASSVGLWDTNG